MLVAQIPPTVENTARRPMAYGRASIPEGIVRFACKPGQLMFKALWQKTERARELILSQPAAVVE